MNLQIKRYFNTNFKKNLSKKKKKRNFKNFFGRKAQKMRII